MKKILFLSLVIAIASGCTVLQRQPFIASITAVDYSQYTAKGFFISESNSVSFNYQPVSSLAAVFMSGYEAVSKTAVTSKDDIYGKEDITIKTTNKYISATRQGALDELYKKAIAQGANGIINLNFRTIREYSEVTKAYTNGYEVTGMAIKK